MADGLHSSSRLGGCAIDMIGSTMTKTLMPDFAFIQGLAAKIKAGMECRVFLFGSHAWGRPNACSDVDLAVVVPDTHYQRKSDVEARKLSQHGLIPIDVLAVRDSTFASAVRGSLSFEVRTRGIEL